MTSSANNTHSRKGVRIGAFVFAPGWLPTLATLLMAVLLFKLGLWQLQRAHYKEDVLQRLETRSKEAPYDLAGILRLAPDINDYPVQITGHYLNDRTLLLDNRTHNQIPGYEVITPFLADNYLILVNRGWMAQGKSRTDFPDIPAIDVTLTVHGTALVPNPDFFVLKEDDYQQVSWPFVIQKIDLEKSARLFDYRLAPFVLRLDPDEQSGFIREWQSHFMGPEKHYGYAVQWFGLFTALWIIYFVVNTKRIPPTK